MNTFFAISRKGNNNNGYILWTQAQRDYIVTTYNKNHSTTQLAEQFSVSSQAIRNVLRKANVKILSTSELKQLSFPRNSDFFSKIDNPQKAYWLGFLYADGYVSKDNGIRINLQKSDEEHLTKFMSAIEYKNGKIKYSQKKDGNKIFEQSYCQVKDKKMTADLADKGCINKKSLVLTFPSTDKVPESLQSHFIRGYFDGDGCLTWSISGKNKRRNYKLNFVGTEDMLNNFKKIFNKEKLALENHHTYYCLNICGNNQVRRILDFLYKDTTDDICLNRKKKKYEDFLSWSIDGELTNVRCE